MTSGEPSLSGLPEPDVTRREDEGFSGVTSVDFDFELFEDDDVDFDFELSDFDFESEDLERDVLLSFSLSFDMEEERFRCVSSLSLLLFIEGDSLVELLENSAVTVASLLLDGEGLDKSLLFCSESFDGFAEEDAVLREECFSVE